MFISMNLDELPGRGELVSILNVSSTAGLESTNSGLNSFSVPRFDTATRAAAVGGVTTLVDNISFTS